MPGFPLAVLAQLAPCCIIPCIAGSQRVRGESPWGKTLLPGVIRMGKAKGDLGLGSWALLELFTLRAVKHEK